MLTYIRHIAAIAAAFLIAQLAGLLGIPVSEEAVNGLTEVLTWIGGGLMLAAYALIEKLLKRPFERLGEGRSK